MDGDSHSQPHSSGSPHGLIVHERDERYFMTRTLQALLKPWRPALVKHSKQPEGPLRLRPPKRCRKYCNIQEREIQGVWVYDFTSISPTQGKHDPKHHPPKRILYYCGGGWQMPPSAHHWALCTELACRVPNTTVTVIAYPLAPNNPVSVAFPQIESVYKALLKDATKAGEKVIVAGDSSGGNLALAVVTWTLMNQKNDATKAPAAILAISPTTDLRHEVAEIKEVEKLDPIMTHAFINTTASTWSPGPERPGTGEITVTEPSGRSYHLDWGFKDPRVSPIQADLDVLARYGVKVYGVIGSYDVLAPEAVAFLEKLKAQGVEGEWLSWKGQMHCFPLPFRYGLKEAVQGVDWIVDMLNKV